MEDGYEHLEVTEQELESLKLSKIKWKITESFLKGIDMF